MTLSHNLSWYDKHCTIQTRFIQLNLQKIYRCWIVWRKNVYVVIIPSFLAITYLGRSIYLHLTTNLNLSLLLLASWGAASAGGYEIMTGTSISSSTITWSLGWSLYLTALAATMAVNTLVTGLIVFKILNGLLEVKRSLGSFSSAAGRPNYQHIVFIIIESGMALFATQLVRIVMSILDKRDGNPTNFGVAFDLIVVFHQMVNVIISSVHFYTFVLLITSTWLGHRTNNNIGASLNGIVLQ